MATNNLEQNNILNNEENSGTNNDLNNHKNDEKEKKHEKKKNIFYIIVAIIIFLLLLKISSCVIPTLGQWKESNDGNNNPEKPTLTIEDGNIYDGERGYKKEASEENVLIPGYGNLIFTSKYPKVKLINDETNTVYLKYTIYNGNDIVYETNAIKPGNMVEANLYEKLDPGSYELTFLINTFDVETQEPGTSTTQTISVTVQN
ncbi:MAG: hypothetical protein MR409_01840 [Lachnospiraceae bacterium]|nr:hypothetical protein [Lachnospiraceae bacterium]